jgi:biotin carboxyl carrier protein
MQHRVSVNDAPHRLWLGRSADGYVLHVGDAAAAVALRQEPGGQVILETGGRKVPMTVAVDGDVVHIHLDGEAYRLAYTDAATFHAAEAGGAAGDVVRAPMPGVVIASPVAAGDAVAAGDTLIVIESMKLETAIKSPRAGVVESVAFTLGQSFDRDVILVKLIAEEE